MFEVRDGVLWELRAGKPALRVCTAFEIDRVICNDTRSLWAYDCWALDIDNQLVRFRIEPRDYLGICTVGLEQRFAATALYLWNVAALVRFLRQYAHAGEPTIMTDLRVRGDGDFKEGSNRRFRAAFEKTRRVA